MTKKIALIFGTRPEIIKMAPFIHEAIKRQTDFFVIHTGQHYSEVMDKVFWENLDLPLPKYNLGVGSGTHAEQVGKMLIAIEPVLMEERPDFVAVYADLNSSIAGALAAAKLHIPIIQLEAGLRSFDRDMPEEINRLVVDKLSTYLFSPTPLQREHLKNEGITEGVFMVGNLISDAVKDNLPKALAKSHRREELGLEKQKYFLATVHRPSSVDNPENFRKLLIGLGKVSTVYNLPVIYPVHPRSRKNLDLFSLSVPTGVRLIEPMDYFNFLALASEAKLLLSDSGGIQEEAAIMQVPLVTLRENTERQETLALGSNVLAGFDPETILFKVKEMETRPRSWQHPYGDCVASKMWDILEHFIGVNNKLSIIIPCCNEEKNVPRLVTELWPVLEALKLDFEVVVVDDGSKDDTVNEVNKINKPQLRLVRHEINKGLGAAMRTGIATATGDRAIFLDSDLTFSPTLIPYLLKAFKLHPKVDFVIGSPNLGGYSKDIPIWRLWISKIANLVYRLLLGKRITSINQIFRLYKTEQLKQLSLSAVGFDINAEILFKLVFSGKKFIEIPAELTARLHGVSKLNYTREIIRHLVLMLKILKWKFFGF